MKEVPIHKYGLTQSQAQGYDEIVDWYNDKNSNIHILSGYAGTGKTYLLQRLITNLFNKNVCVTAPTHRALRILETVTGKTGLTIQALNGLRPNMNLDDFRIDQMKFDRLGEQKMRNFKVIITDEASMLNSDLETLMSNNAKNFGIKLLYVGDPCQLPPIKEPFSPVFHADYPTLELTEIIRQAEDNPIIELSRNLHYLKSKVPNRVQVGGYIFSNNFDSVVSTLAAVNGSDELKYLAWTNQDIDYVNKKVRESIYGTPAKIEIGESLIFNTPYKDFFTNDEVKVEELSIEEKNFTAYKKINPHYSVDNFNASQYLENTRKLKYYVVNKTINILHESSEGMFTDMKKDMRKRCIEKLINWRDFYEFVEQFADIKYNHAISIHKSQGSTYNQVIINIKNCMLNKDIDEREKLLYTAITRAKELVVLYNT